MNSSNFENKRCLPCVLVVNKEETINDGNRLEHDTNGLGKLTEDGASSIRPSNRPLKKPRYSEFDTVDEASEKQVHDIMDALGVAALENVLVEHCWQVLHPTVLSFVMMK